MTPDDDPNVLLLTEHLLVRRGGVTVLEIPSLASFKVRSSS